MFSLKNGRKLIQYLFIRLLNRLWLGFSNLKEHSFTDTLKPLCSCSGTEHYFLHFLLSNIVPVHKNNDKQFIKNYRPEPLLSSCAKGFEKMIFNSLFKYLDEINVLTSNQAGFHSGDLGVYYLLSKTLKIYEACDPNPTLDVRRVFLHSSKALDAVYLMV